MKCTSEFIYKSLEKREGGEFVNSQGQTIKYDSSYVIKVDETTSSGIYERKFKFPKNNLDIIKILSSLDPYTHIEIEFDVSIYGSQAKLIPTNVKVVN